MRYSASEKYEIIRLVEASSLPIRQTLRQLDIGKSAFYSWLKRYQDNGIDGLEDKKPSADDYSRYIIAWRLCSGMAATDVQNTLDDALAFTGLDQVEVNHKPRLLSDNGPCYVSGELSDYLEQQGMTHTRGAPYHPQTQGKIERWRRSMKNQILLNHYYLPSELQEHLQRFIRYYNHERYHESLDNLTPADVFYGRDQDILEQRQPIKHNTMSMRRKMVYDNRNNLTNLMS